MTTLVLGHLVLDEIHAWDGSVYHAAGGITFSLGAFDALAEEDDRVVPVFPFGSDATDIVDDLAMRFRHVDFSSCWQVPEGNTRVRLFHESPAQYNTQLVRSLAPVPRERYAPLLAEAKLVYCNLMTGEDILPQDAAALRGEGRLVFIDLHMIAYRVHRDGRREPAPAAQWKQWFSAGDIVQCNEREFVALTGRSGADTAYVRELMEESGTGIFILTRGEDGADIFTTTDAPRHVPAVRVPAAVDPTGCGDAFGATFARMRAGGASIDGAAAEAAARVVRRERDAG
ncbi:MAG: carbohydrate kinase family protein, partial [Bacteroidota bacterium]|nr:carbohydrate kinase family protein [Bacteroidota bacterium]